MAVKLTAATAIDLWLGLLRFCGTTRFFQQCLSLCVLIMVSFEVPSHFYAHSFSVQSFSPCIYLAMSLTFFPYSEN